MRVLSVVFVHTFREALRKKFLIGLLTACFLILCMSLLFSQLSLDDKGRLTIDFGLAAVQLLMLILSVFFGAGLISKDLDVKILWTVFTGPVRPSLFFLGRYLGLALFLFLALVAFSLLLIIFFFSLKIPIQTVLFYSLFGFLFESFLLLAFVFFFSGFVNTFLVLFYSVSVFVIGHFLNSLFYFFEKAEGEVTFLFSLALRLVPNLERVNWKSAVVYQDQVAFSDFALSSFYIFLWVGFVLSLALLLMEKREYI